MRRMRGTQSPIRARRVTCVHRVDRVDRGPGAVSIRAYVGPADPAAPITVGFDDYTATAP